ncbi:MAG: hypothetical protein KBA75_00895 [Alphaproteobacteria bacterium]|nr:hypothetical protein [Alphaproteobacteria bacterium]
MADNKELEAKRQKLARLYIIGGSVVFGLAVILRVALAETDATRNTIIASAFFFGSLGVVLAHIVQRRSS